jgi:hypothetical protein
MQYWHGQRARPAASGLVTIAVCFVPPPATVSIITCSEGIVISPPSSQKRLVVP